MTSTSMLISLGFGVFIGLVVAYLGYAYFATVAKLKAILATFPSDDASQLLEWDKEGMLTLYPTNAQRIVGKIYDEVPDEIAVKMKALAGRNKSIRFC